MVDLSVVIPARNEMFLKHTIDDLIKHIKGNTEIIAILDGYWPEPGIPDHPMVTLIHHVSSIGQRAATNEGVKISNAKYIMKVDAHCAFDDGFDIKMISDMQDDWTMVPLMKNLHVFDWVCPDGHRRYQGPSGVCTECEKPTVMEIIWHAKNNPLSTSYCFDPEPHFQYFNDYKDRPGGRDDITETMSLQGSCFMMTRDKYNELNVCDETLGSWGSQGIEVAVKTWLSGGKVMCNHKTWYGHCFRTQGGDFGFPYPMSGKQVQRAKKSVRDLFFNNKWPQQKYPLSWLVEKFWPVPGWKDEDLSNLKKADSLVVPPLNVNSSMRKGLVYYTDNRLDPRIMETCQKQLVKAKGDLPLVTVSLQPMDFGDNIVIDRPRGIMTMFQQILAGLERIDCDIVYLVEHDLLYHPSHFDFTPPTNNTFYYNENTWKVNSSNGQCLFHYTKQTSGLCAYRDLLIGHYRRRIAKLESNARELTAQGLPVKNDGFSRHMGFEPGCHQFPRGVDHYKAERWMSPCPNVDIRHGNNLTRSRWTQEEFRNPNSCLGWTLADDVPCWGTIKGRFDEWLASL